MSEATTHFTYDGDALRSGTMDVQELAPALLAVGTACERANLILNGDLAKVSVRVKSEFVRGSFGLDLDIVQTIHTAVLSDTYKTAKEILWLLGLGAGPGAGLIWLVKWARGRKLQSANQLPDGSVEVTVQDSVGAKVEVTKVNANVVILFNDSMMRDSVGGIIRPLESPGIDTFKIMEGSRVLDTVTKEDVPSFSSPLTDEVLISDKPFQAKYEIVKLSFTDRYKWSLSDGNAVFNADIEDEGFFRKLTNREYAFAKGDILEVRVRVAQYQSSKGLRTRYIVTRVLNVYPPRQGPLFND